MQAKKDIFGLTGLRGVAACWVVTYHVFEFSQISGPLAVLLRHGYLAVDFFFVLSGFVMALSYQGLFSGGFTVRKYCVFLLRRAARIYPLYFILTMLIAASSLHGEIIHHQVFGALKGLVKNLTLTESWGIGDPIDGPSWSISTELAAYLLFPVLAALTIYARLRTAVAVAIICVIAVALISTLPTPASYPWPREGPLDISWAHTVWPLIRCVLEFSLGLVAFRCASIGSIRSMSATSVWAWSVSFGLVALLFLHGFDVLILMLIPLLLLALVDGKSLVPRLLSSPVAMTLGRLSYAIYLLHFPLIRVQKFVARKLASTLGVVPSDILASIVFFVVLLVLAELCYRFIEAPGRSLIRRLEERLFPREDRLLAVTEG